MNYFAALGKIPIPLFIVIEAKHSMVRDWTNFFKSKFVTKCPFPIQVIREIVCQKDHSRLLSYRSSYSGTWLQSPIIKAQKRKLPKSNLANEFELPSEKYNGMYLLNIVNRDEC